MDSLSTSTPGLIVSGDYWQGNQVWNHSSNAYEAFTTAHYNAGYYSTSAPEAGSVTLAGVVLNSTTSVTCSSTASLVVGQEVVGFGIPAGATIASISSGTVFVLSASATTSSATGTYLAGVGSGRYVAATPAGVTAAGAYSVIFRKHVDGTIANDVPIGSGSSAQLASVSLASAAVASSIVGNSAPFTQDFACLTGVYWQQSITITGLDSTGWNEFVWTLKDDSAAASDDEALATIRLTNGGSGSDGLLVNNGRAAATAGNAGLAVGGISPDTSVTWTIQAAAMDLPPSPTNADYYWELTRFIGSRKEAIGSGRVALSRSNRRGLTSP